MLVHRLVNSIIEDVSDIEKVLALTTMTYRSAQSVNATLGAITAAAGAITAAAHDARLAHEVECKRLTTIIEGLLANWPEVEVGAVCVLAADPMRPVLTKKAALETALEVVKSIPKKG